MELLAHTESLAYSPPNASTRESPGEFPAAGILTDTNLLTTQGHDFVVLGRSPALSNPLDPSHSATLFNPTTDIAGLKWTNPTRRDTTVLPGWGWLVVAFKPENPGSWVFHCHIAWHVSQGFSVQFLERTADVKKDMDLAELSQNCDAWRDYAPKNEFLKSGLGVGG